MNNIENKWKDLNAAAEGMKTFWKHLRTGDIYELVLFANEFCDNPEKFPPIAVYRNKIGDIFARPANEFFTSFTRVEA